MVKERFYIGVKTGGEGPYYLTRINKSIRTKIVKAGSYFAAGRRPHEK